MVTFNTNETSEVADSLAINHGRHNFKFGGQWRNSPVVNAASNLPRGQLTFTVEAFDTHEKIGEGTHERVVVDPARLIARAEAKRP